MKIISECWADKTLVVTGFHLDPAKYVVRIHQMGKQTILIELDTYEQLRALESAVFALTQDGRTPREVATQNGVAEGQYTSRMVGLLIPQDPELEALLAEEDMIARRSKVIPFGESPQDSTATDWAYYAEGQHGN